MNCGRAQNLLSAYLDRELAGSEMLAIQEHLRSCPACAAEQQSLQSVRALLGSMGRVEPRDPEALIMATLNRRHQASPPGLWSRMATWWAFSAPRAGLAAAAACLTVGVLALGVALHSSGDMGEREIVASHPVMPIQITPPTDLLAVDLRRPLPRSGQRRASTAEEWWKSPDSTLVSR
jgi:anti-sigma factor RsiW